VLYQHWPLLWSCCEARAPRKTALPTQVPPASGSCQHHMRSMQFYPRMQKSVRRGLGGSAQKLAYALLEADTPGALRRLPIICIEDTVLHPQLPAAVWLMVAQSKGFALPIDGKALVATLAGECARCPLHDVAVGDGNAADDAAIGALALALPLLQLPVEHACDALCT
jgi:hypothetical protein